MKTGQIIELEGKEYKYIGSMGRNCHVFISNEGTEIAFTNEQLANYIENGEVKLKEV